jgi:hypothetical protein
MNESVVNRLRILALCIAAFMLPTFSFAGELTRTDGFDVEYIVTFVFDACGDTSYGQWYRQAIMAKVEACPFTEAARKGFYVNVAHSVDDTLSELITYVDTHKSMPPEFLGERLSKEQCSKIIAQPSTIAFKKKLDQFRQKKIPISEFTKAELGTCEDGAKPVFEPAPPNMHNNQSSGKDK